jgi:hypothetical protein
VSRATWGSRPWCQRVKNINTDCVKNIKASFLLEIKGKMGQLRNSMEQNPSWETNNHSADKKKIPILQSPPMDPALSHMNPIHTPTPYSLMVGFNMRPLSHLQPKSLRALLHPENENRLQFWIAPKDYLFTSLWLIQQRSSACIARGYGLDGRGSIPGRGKIFPFCITSRPAMGPTQPPIQWVPGLFPRQ